MCYFYRTRSCCKIIYYDLNLKTGKLVKRYKEISFKPESAEPTKCVSEFNKIAESFGEKLEPEVDSQHYTNQVYSFFKGKYKGETTVLDMNSAYLWALNQPLADYTTKKELTKDEVIGNKEYDYFLFENSIHRLIVYKKHITQLISCLLFENVKIYGFKSKCFFPKTVEKLFYLKKHDDSLLYKNVANIYIGCLHKRSGINNNDTLVSSLYALFHYNIETIVKKFENKGYKVIMVTTDAIKIAGSYNESDNLIQIGDGLGEFKYEFIGEANYESVGHYTEDKVKWKGKPAYLQDGNANCEFINPDKFNEEIKIYEKYAICKKKTK